MAPFGPLAYSDPNLPPFSLGIPKAFRPAALDARAITIVRTDANAALKVARDAATALAKAQATGADIAAEESLLGTRRRVELDKPLGPVREDLSALRTRIKDSFSILPETKLAATPDATRPLADLLGFASKLETLATNQVELIAERRHKQVESAATASAKTLAILGEHGFTDMDALENGIAHTMADVAGYQQQQTRAKGEVSRANALDAVITPAAELRDGLREVTRHVQPGSFIGFVVHRKQRDLLVYATEVLQEITGGRFGFSSDFQIIDTETMQPRSPRTLSGGERFLASLALALGLVELAQRGGGRLEALFLDEGFGSLDNESLQDALDALEKVAAGHYRMIGLITHIRAVADRIPKVLKVSRTVAGSQSVWLSPAESEEAAEAELSAGMLA